MIQIAITLEPNCKKSEHNWAFVEQGKTCEIEMQSLKDLHACRPKRRYFHEGSAIPSSATILRTFLCSLDAYMPNTTREF